MPFMPLSPTRLYPSHDYKIYQARAEASPKQGPRAIDMASFEGSASNVESNSNSAHRSSWKGATIRHVTTEDQTTQVTDNDQALRMDIEHFINCRPVTQARDSWNRGNEWDHELQSQKVTRSPSFQSDKASESEYSVEEDTGPVLGRASTVRVSKPNVIENKPTKKLDSRSLCFGHLRSQEVDHAEEYQTEKPPSMSEGTGRAQSNSDADPNTEGYLRDSTLVEPFHFSMPTSFSIGGGNNSTHNNTNPQLALPTGSTLHSIHPSVVRSETSSISGNENSKIGLNGTASAPLPLPRRGISRRVTIRPPDIVTKSRDPKSNFRESVVTTPYPPHLPDGIGSIDLNQNEKSGFTEQQHREMKREDRVSFPNSQGERDRFPSPERPHVLFLNIGIEKHPYAAKRVEIQMAKKSTFDDQALFEQIRAVYFKQLVNSYRRIFLLVRKVQHISFPTSSLYSSEPDTLNFLQHLRNPRSGHKRKVWILWLRKLNSDQTSRCVSFDRAHIRHIDDLNRLSGRARTNPHSRNTSGSSRDTEKIEDNKRLSTASDASSFYFAYSPAIPKLPFLSHRHYNDNFRTQSSSHPPSSHRNSFFWPGNTHSQHYGQNNTNNSSSKPTDNEILSKNPTIWIHYEFRLGMIALLFLLNILLSATCAVIWIIFGVPGSGPGRNSSQQLGDITIVHDWKIDAQARVFVGVIIGLVVLFAGCLVEAALVSGSWVFL